MRRKTSNSTLLSQDKKDLTMASTETSPSRTLMSLPDELLQRLLVGVPLEDHHAAASACVAFRDVINGPKFLALRRQYGFAERGVVLLQTRAISGTSLKIRAARKNGDVSLPTICSHPSTTDGGSRLFVSSLELVPNQRERIMAVDVSSCRWKCVTALPMVFRENSLPGHCMEWHGGLLYVAGGRDNEDNYTLVANGQSAHNSLHVFNETTDSWEELPPMPHATAFAASGVIGDQLLIVGGSGSAGSLLMLQIYDIATRTWSLGTAPPRPFFDVTSVVVDGKLLLFHESGLSVYDSHSESWTEEEVYWSAGSRRGVVNACVHKGRTIGFSREAVQGPDDRWRLHIEQFERATDGSWSPGSCGVDLSGLQDFVSESVILG